jgi:TolB-like protein
LLKKGLLLPTRVIMTDLVERLQAELSDRYRIRRSLGHGGMGIVALADDLRHDRSVAIKIIEPHVSGAVGRERFLREIRVGAALTHPHIVPLLDSGEAAGLLYYVMPYVEGETLRQLIERSAPLSLADAAAICLTLADALGYAHARGLVHRDVKPENVILAAGHAYLTDFGICRALDEAGGDGLTRAGVTLGTPAYMSPEQWSHPERADGRSDLYSLGCILFELLTGEPPYSGNSPAALMARHTSLEVPSARLLRPGLPPPLDHVIGRTLAKVPAERIATAGEFADALRAAVEGGTAAESVPHGASAAPVRGTRAPESQGPATRRHAMTYGGLAAVALVAAGFLSVRGLLPDRGGVEETPAVHRVAVGLIENRTDDAALDMLGRMAAEWISEGLHRTGFVAVVPSATALEAWDYVAAQERQPAGGRIAAFARETGSSVVVSGAYYRDGDSVYTQLQLVDVRSGGTLAALQPVAADPAAPGASMQLLRDRVIGALAVSLDERIRASWTERPPQYDAYQAFSRGLDRYVRNQDRAAAAEFRAAFGLDTTFTLPLLYEAFSRSNLGELASVDSLVRRIGERRGELNVYHLAWFEYLEERLSGDHDGALRAIRRAAELAPESKASYNRAWAAQLANRPAEARAALLSLDPDRGIMRGWYPYWEVLTAAHHRLGEHQAELQAAREARRRFRDHPGPARLEAAALAALGNTADLGRLFDEAAVLRTGDPALATELAAAAAELRAHDHPAAAAAFLDRAVAWIRPLAAGSSDPDVLAALGEVLHERGDWAEARTVIEGLAARFPDRWGYRAWAAILAAAGGDRQTAMDTDRWLADLDDPWTFGSVTLHRARIAAQLGDGERAVALLRQALAEGLPALRHLDHNFHRIRDHPALVALLAPRSD